MNKKDVLEIKRRFRKEACTFTRMCGCYVDADHNKITKIGETFLTGISAYRGRNRRKTAVFNGTA